MKTIAIGIGDLASSVVENIPKENLSDSLVFKRQDFSTFNQDLESFENEFKLKKKSLEIKDDVQNVFCFVCGNEGIAGISLKVLESFKEKRIFIFFLKKNDMFLSETERKNQKISFGVLQELARSGVFQHLFVLNVEQMFTEICKTPEMTTFFVAHRMLIDKLVFCAYSLWCSVESQPIFGQKFDLSSNYRISTFFEIFSEELKLFFDLKNVERLYFLSFFDPESKTSVNDFAKAKSVAEKFSEKMKTSFGIFSDDVVNLFGIASSKIVQDADYYDQHVAG